MPVQYHAVASFKFCLRQAFNNCIIFISIYYCFLLLAIGIRGPLPTRRRCLT